MAEYRLPTIPEFKKAESGQSPDLSFESSIFDRATRHDQALRAAEVFLVLVALAVPIR